MHLNTIEKLEWDSGFFGYPVASINLDRDGHDRLDDIFKHIASEKFRLTYFFVPPAEEELNKRIAERGALLIDQKTEYTKKTEKYDQFASQIIEFQAVEINKNLTDLALQAGLYSRFRMDKNFMNCEFERLYIEWITKSIKKIIAFKTLIVEKDSEIIGITTLGKKHDYANIGLVAIDDKCRGQGIGCDLIHAADNIAFDMGFKEIKVVTQFQNKGGCRLYEKCGFRVEKITNVYHYWLLV